MGKLNFIETHLAEHCNLSCFSCNHNSPLAEPEFPDPIQMLKDFTKLSKLTNGTIDRINLCGGEPLLNRDIAYIIRLVKGMVPNSELYIITNGILLPHMSEIFWDTCRYTNVLIVVSAYKIPRNIDLLRKISKHYDVRIKIGNWWSFAPEPGTKFDPGIGEYVDVFLDTKYDMSGSRPIRETWELCSLTGCTFLKNGKIYNCPQIPSSVHLEKAFDVKFEITSDDYIELNNVNHLSQILDFLNKPNPFCRYCVIQEPQVFVDWKIGKKKKEEYFIS